MNEKLRGEAGKAAADLATNLTRQSGLRRQIARLQEEQEQLCKALAAAIPKGETRDLLAWGCSGDPVHLNLYHPMTCKGDDDTVDPELTLLEPIEGLEWVDPVSIPEESEIPLEAVHSAADNLRMPGDRSLRP